jgi:hypothetical protein
MINEVRNAVMFILNKDNNGYLTPSEFNAFARLAQLEVFEELFQKVNNSYIRRNNRTANSGVADLGKKYSQELDRFVSNVALSLDSGSTFNMPADTYSLVDVIYNNKSVERVSQHKITMLNASNMTAPSLYYPAYIDTETKITVYPTTINTGVNAIYLRLPADPKWTYFTDPTTNSPIFDSSANDYQDFELGKEDEVDLVLRILAKAGVTLRESSIIDVVNMEEAKKDQADK